MATYCQSCFICKRNAESVKKFMLNASKNHIHAVCSDSATTTSMGVYFQELVWAKQALSHDCLCEVNTGKREAQ
jgi:L-fucose isomerase-like protein